MYAVIATFDHFTDRAIRQIWQDLADQGLSTYASERSGMVPHLTLASYEELVDVSTLIERLEAHYINQPVLSVNFSSLGTFLGSQLIFLAPQVTANLLDFHAKHYQTFKDLLDSTSLYTPNTWSPHVSLANYLSESSFSQVFAYCQKHLLPLVSQLTAVKLIKINPDKSVEMVWETNLS